MRLILHVLAAIAVTAVLAWQLIFPVPPFAASHLEPLWDARDGEREVILDRQDRVHDAEGGLRRAFPAGGRPVQNRFGATPTTSTPAFGGFPELHAPLGLRAVAQEGGVRLSWRPHPKNPVEGLRYRVERWNAAGEQEATWVQDSLERLDQPGCEGLPYAYRVSALLVRQLEVGGSSQPLSRYSPPARVSLRLERRTAWQAALGADGGLLLTLEQPGRPDEGPFEALPGQALGSTGWTIESWTKGETEVIHVARSPRFDELGRRVVIDGRPASRVREEPRMRTFVTLSLLDPCGIRLRENLFLAEEGPR